MADLDLAEVRKLLEQPHEFHRTRAIDLLIAEVERLRGQVPAPQVEGGLDLEAIGVRAACAAAAWSCTRNAAGVAQQEIHDSAADVPKLVAEIQRLQRLLAEPFPTSDGYEQMAAALTDMRGLVVEILRYFYDLGQPGQAMYRSNWVPADTLARWRQIVGETGV